MKEREGCKMNNHVLDEIIVKDFGIACVIKKTLHDLGYKIDVDSHPKEIKFKQTITISIGHHL